jgi:hypothetical protein
MLHGPLEQHAPLLTRLNQEGAGIFVAINATDPKGRKARNITCVRALYIDLDGAPLDLVWANDPSPHIVIRTSPGKWHVYWLVNDVAVEDFSGYQRALIAKFGSDKSVNDLPRVMRLPGFFHSKAEPCLVTIDRVCSEPAYSAAQFSKADEKFSEPSSNDDDLPPPDTAEIESALDVLPSENYSTWFEVGSALFNVLGESGKLLFQSWSKKSAKYDEKGCARQWENCKSYPAFTAGTIFHYADLVSPSWRKQTDASGQARSKRLLLSSAAFIDGFRPPDYLIDGILQRGFLYSFTAPTGTGKTAIAMCVAAHVAYGLTLGGRDVDRGKVLFLAGENPDDIRTRWIKLCEENGDQPEASGRSFHGGCSEAFRSHAGKAPWDGGR